MTINVASPLIHERNLAKRPSPILSDGTPLSDLIDLDKREVKLRVLNDPELHQMELRRIFARAWVMLGHVSEIPNAGDFIKRAIGQDEVIVTRGRNGEISVLLNACSHRGMEICWADQGNQSSFKCPYHGWVFDTAGRLMGAPFEREMYGDWDKSQYGLMKAHVAVRHGVIFGAFRPLGDLDDWMGEFGWYFDLIYGSSEMEILAPPVALGGLTRANWKAAGEQNCGDGYHTVTLHHCLAEMGFMNPPPTDITGWSLDCYDVSSYEGHGLRIAEQSHNIFHVTPEPEPFPVGWFVAGSMFPGNFTGMTATRGAGVPMEGVGSVQTSSESVVGYTANIGGMTIRGPNGYTLWMGQLVEKTLPEAARENMRQLTAFNAVIGADDMESWPSMTRVAQGAVGGEQPIRYNALVGPSKPDGFPGPALVHRGMSKDDNQWHFWLRWYDLMTTPESTPSI